VLWLDSLVSSVATVEGRKTGFVLIPFLRGEQTEIFIRLACWCLSRRWRQYVQVLATDKFFPRYVAYVRCGRPVGQEFMHSRPRLADIILTLTEALT